MSEPDAQSSIRAALHALRATDAQSDVDESDAAARFAAAQQEAEADFARIIQEARVRRNNAEAEANRQRDAARASAFAVKEQAAALAVADRNAANDTIVQVYPIVNTNLPTEGANILTVLAQPDPTITGGNPSQLLSASRQRTVTAASSIMQAAAELQRVRTRQGKLLRLGLAALVGVLFAVLLFVIAAGLQH